MYTKKSVIGICYGLALIFSLIDLPLIAQENQMIMGQEWFNEVNQSYQKGNYNQFLKQIDARYQKGLREGEWNDFLKSENELAEQFQKRPEELKAKEELVRKELIALESKMSEQLMQLAENNPKLFISKVLKSVYGSNVASEEHKPGLELMYQLELRLLPKSPVIEQLEKVADEYKVKKMLVEMALDGILEPTSIGLTSLDDESAEKHEVALEIEELQKMLEMSIKQNATELIIKLKSAQASYGIVTAKSFDYDYLYSLLDGTSRPANQVETKVVELLKAAQSKKRALLQKRGLSSKQITN